MFIVTVALKGGMGAFPDGEGFLNYNDAARRAAEWNAADAVAEAKVTTPADYAAGMIDNMALLVGLGAALGYNVEFAAGEAA